MPFIVRKALDIAIPLIMIKNVKHTTKTDYGEASPFVIKNPENPSSTGWSLSSERCISYLLKEAKKTPIHHVLHRRVLSHRVLSHRVLSRRVLPRCSVFHHPIYHMIQILSPNIRLYQIILILIQICFCLVH